MKSAKEIKMEIKQLEDKIKNMQNQIMQLNDKLIYHPLWLDSQEVIQIHEEIGSYNIDKLCRILSSLHEGNYLLMQHEVYGEYRIHMNPQRNRIVITEMQKTNKHITENEIFAFMLVYPSNWYIVSDKLN